MVNTGQDFLTVVHQLFFIDHGNSDGWDELKQLVETHRDSEWFAAVAGSDSVLGRVAETSVPMELWRLYLWFRGGPSTSRTYEPESTLRLIKVPQHWILAGEDSSAPTGETALNDRLNTAEYYRFPVAKAGGFPHK